MQTQESFCKKKSICKKEKHCSFKQKKCNMPLYNLRCKNCCIIKKLPSINLLHSLGLREGMQVSVLSKQPLGGPVVIQTCNNRCIAVARNVAEMIEVNEV